MPQQEPSHEFSVSSPEHHDRKRPTSELKILANRQNALKSTGPQTLRGKSHSRKNSLKHGLFAKELFRDCLVNREDPEEFVKILADFRAEWQPCGRAEELEVEHIAVCWLKRARLWRYENAEQRVALDLIAIRGQVSSPRELLTPEDKSLILLLEEAQKQIEETGEMPPDLKVKILASAEWLRRLWPKFEDGAQKILQDRNEEIASRIAEKMGLRVAVVKKRLELDPEDRADRARLAALLPVKLAIRSLLLWSQEQYQYVLDGAFDQHAIPNSDSLDRILRYSGMIDRELTRAYDRLERLQRRRKGELVPSFLNLNVNA